MIFNTSNLSRRYLSTSLFFRLTRSPHWIPTEATVLLSRRILKLTWMTLCLEANQEEKRIQQLSSWNTQEPSSKTRASKIKIRQTSSMLCLSQTSASQKSHMNPARSNSPRNQPDYYVAIIHMYWLVIYAQTSHIRKIILVSLEIVVSIMVQSSILTTPLPLSWPNPSMNNQALLRTQQVNQQQRRQEYG